MFNTDKPIEKNSQDCLKRTNFSKQLAKAILNYTKQDNFVISLCGKWGSGKTSIINMVVEEMEKLTKNKEDKNQETSYEIFGCDIQKEKREKESATFV